MIACDICGRELGKGAKAHRKACARRAAVRRGPAAYAEHVGLQRGGAAPMADDEAFDAIDRAVARRGWQWSDVCAAAGNRIHRQLVHQWQRGEHGMQLSSLLLIAEIIGAEPAELLRRDS